VTFFKYDTIPFFSKKNENLLLSYFDGIKTNKFFSTFDTVTYIVYILLY